MQHIITQDFARNQDPTPVPSTASATFQTVMPPASSSGRVKVPSRYSPESQSQGPHHQRPSSRISPENVPDKPRSRCMEHLFNSKWVKSRSNNFLSPWCPDQVNLQTVVVGCWTTMSPSPHHTPTKAWTSRILVGLHHRGGILSQRSGLNMGHVIPIWTSIQSKTDI